MSHGRPIAYEHDGTIKWTVSSGDATGSTYYGDLGVVDFDQDGVYEIYNPRAIWSAIDGSLIVEKTS